MTAPRLDTDQAVCPHCGFVDQDSWELGNGEDGQFVTDCGSCGKAFLVNRSIRITYSTEKP